MPDAAFGAEAFDRDLLDIQAVRIDAAHRGFIVSR